MPDTFEAEVERRLGRPFAQVQTQLEEFLDLEWDDVLVVVETSASKTDRDRVDVIADLIGKAEHKPAVQERVKRGVIRWIGKPWRERENPWDKFKDRVPGPPPKTDTTADDLEEWVPFKADE